MKPQRTKGNNGITTVLTLSSAKLRDFQPPMKISNGLHFRDPRLNFAAAGVIVNSPLWWWPITDVTQTKVVCIFNSPW